MTATSRYKLFASTADAKAPCAFFASPAGCRNGDSCKFSHGGESPQETSFDNSSVVSSESEGQVAAPPPPPMRQQQQQQHQPEMKVTPTNKKSSERKKRKTSSSSSDVSSSSSIFAAPKSKKVARASTPSKLKQGSNTPKENAPGTSISQKPKTPTFRDLQLPVASFSIPSNENQATNPSANSAAQAAPPNVLPLPTSTKVGKSWVPVVKATRVHPRYKSTFDFEKEIAGEIEANKCTSDQDWFQPKPFGSWCKSNPQAIAIDCEMCETKCPRTGAINSRALCRVSVIDAENPSDVLLDTLVKPDWPVRDHRTWVNGITEEHLKDVKFTLEHAQNFMKALCSDETVIVGHALHNDLFALRMIHNVVADSAFLFQVKDAENPLNSTCSLSDLTLHIQKLDMPKVHDSVNDARMSLINIVKGWKDKGGKDIEAIPRTNKERKSMNPLAPAQLFCHRIPKICQPEHLQSLFEEHSHIIPAIVNPVEFGQNPNKGKTVVTFASARHANLAFDTLDGEPEVEKSGRQQKKVYLRNGDYLNVRKMIHGRKNEQKPPSNKATK